MDEDPDPEPDAFSTLYDPLGGLRQRWLTRLSWRRRVLLLIGLWGVVIVIIAIAVLSGTNHL